MLVEFDFPLLAPCKLVSGNLCTPSLNRKTWNEVLGSVFVNISATCKDDGRKQVIKTPLATFFPNKMIVQLDMLGTCMEDGIYCHVKGIEIIA